MATRFLSLWFPRIGAERWLRLGACPVGQPLVTVAGTGMGDRVQGVSAAASAVGIEGAMSLGEAFAAYPALTVLPADGEAETDLLRALARAARMSGWDAVPDPPDGLEIALDVQDPEEEGASIAQALTAASAAGFSARPGMADTAPGARALARFGTAGRGGLGRIAARGRTKEALSPLPVEALRLAPASLRRLERLGVRRIGEIADWPDPAVRRYLGADVADRLRDALGRAPDVLDTGAWGDGVVPFAAAGLRLDRRLA